MAKHHISVCTDEDAEELTVTEDDQDGFTITDNSDGPNGPTDGVTDDDVPIFDDSPATIPIASDEKTPYSVNFKTPVNTEVTPTSLITPNLTNVKKIVVIINGEELAQVSSLFDDCL